MIRHVTVMRTTSKELQEIANKLEQKEKTARIGDSLVAHEQLLAFDSMSQVFIEFVVDQEEAKRLNLMD